MLADGEASLTALGCGKPLLSIRLKLSGTALENGKPLLSMRLKLSGTALESGKPLQSMRLKISGTALESGKPLILTYSQPSCFVRYPHVVHELSQITPVQIVYDQEVHRESHSPNLPPYPCPKSE